MRLKFFADPGHGWLKVERKWLKTLNIANKISSCSYERGNDVYLEEDCDASMFLTVAKRQGIEIKTDECRTSKSSKIRSYNSYRPDR